MDKDKRQFVKIIKEICEENAIEFKSFSYDWILQLNANNKIMFIFGYRFPNNDASIDYICSDKAALSSVLTEHNIPHVKHFYFVSPLANHYMTANGDWDQIIHLFNEYGILVCKSNEGSGGSAVYKVESRQDLEIAVARIFSGNQSMCISPYISIKSEYRVILFNSRVGVIYQKQLLNVVGDGKTNLRTLINKSEKLNNIEIDHSLNLESIPNLGEEVNASWKHNLGQGATCALINDIALKDKLTNLALSCATTLNIQFASIDIIEDQEGLKILEINSGIMMEHFSKINPSTYAQAKNIYKMAITSYLNINDK